MAKELALAEGKRDDIFSPATSGHVLKILPAVFLQKSVMKMNREKEEESLAMYWGVWTSRMPFSR